MKTKKAMKGLLTAAVIGLIFTGCKKNQDNGVKPVDDTPQQTMSASDQTNVENESNEAMDDANSALQGISSTRSFNFCNVTIDSSQASTGLIVLTYTGNNCANTKLRSGSISIQLPYIGGQVRRWRDTSATVTLTFNTYKVTRLSDNKSITLNGTHSITNVSGGLLATITPGNPRVHKIRANLQLTFDDGTQRTWQAARTRTYNIANNIVTDQVTGDTTINGYSNVAMWGVNRAGNNFYTSITTPVISNIFGGTCLYKPISGVRVHYGLVHTITVTYGVESNGNATPSGNCPYGYKVNWVNGQGSAVQVIKPY